MDYIQEGLQAQQDAQESAAEQRARLSAMKLLAPEACAEITTGFLYAICETEPDPDKDWPDWTLLAGAPEQACVTAAFHQTNAHAAKINGAEYDGAEPDGNRIGWFVSDLCRASLFTESINYGDTDASAADLIAGFFADRSESRVKPSMDY